MKMPKVIAILLIVAGAILIGAGSITYYVVHDTLADEKIVVSDDADYLAGEKVEGPFTAYAQAAVIDPVSGLFNRRYFQARLEEELHRAIRQATSVALLMVDLDGFKSINDRFGHVAGDMVIRDISEILRRSLRSTTTTLTTSRSR